MASNGILKLTPAVVGVLCVPHVNISHSSHSTHILLNAILLEVRNGYRGQVNAKGLLQNVVSFEILLELVAKGLLLH